MVEWLLDTCVISELLKPAPEPTVVAWVDRAPPERLFLSAITMGEVTRGAAQLPVNARRRSLETWIDETESSFSGRILPVDVAIARIWGAMTSRLRSQGIQLAPADGLIAATAIAHRLTVVTRNVKDFQATGVDIINPWDS